MVAAFDFQLQVCYIMIMGEKGPMFYYPITINTTQAALVMWNVEWVGNV